jgi:hypothetical protein
MTEKPIEMRAQLLSWHDLIEAVETQTFEAEEMPDPLWIAVDEILNNTPIAKN